MFKFCFQIDAFFDSCSGLQNHNEQLQATAELDDIATFGIRDIGASHTYSGDKLFAPTLSEAAKFGRINYGFDKLPNTIIKVKVPNSVLNNAYRFGADGMNAIEIQASQLHLLKATPLNYSPLH